MCYGLVSVCPSGRPSHAGNIETAEQIKLILGTDASLDVP